MPQLARRARHFSASASRNAAEVKSLGVIGAGQMVCCARHVTDLEDFVLILRKGVGYCSCCCAEGWCACDTHRFVSSLFRQGSRLRWSVASWACIFTPALLIAPRRKASGEGRLKTAYHSRSGRQGEISSHAKHRHRRSVKGGFYNRGCSGDPQAQV